jgi:hypothetical protein
MVRLRQREFQDAHEALAPEVLPRPGPWNRLVDQPAPEARGRRLHHRRAPYLGPLNSQPSLFVPALRRRPAHAIQDLAKADWDHPESVSE